MNNLNDAIAALTSAGLHAEPRTWTMGETIFVGSGRSNHAGIAHVRSGRLRSLLAVAVFGMLVASLRLSLLPVVLGFAPLPVLAHLLADHRRWLRAGLHLVVVIAATLFCHKAYQR